MAACSVLFLLCPDDPSPTTGRFGGQGAMPQPLSARPGGNSHRNKKLPQNPLRKISMDEKIPNAVAASDLASSPAIASELNNLLQIISDTSALIENIWEGNEGADKYFNMLRTSVARAAEVTTQLVELSGNLNGKIVLHPEFTGRRQTRTAPKKDAPRRRILVVDDEKMLLILASEVLREAGYDVVTAQSGFECLDLFRASPRTFDLVLLDVSMPLMDGEETFNRLRALRPDVRVLLCTGYIQQERLNHMLEAGLAGFLQKPVGTKEYVASIRATLARAMISDLGASSAIASAV